MEIKQPEMEINNIDEISLNDLLFKVKKFSQYIVKRWLIFLLFSFLGLVVGLAIQYLQTPKYTAECTFVLDEKSGSGGGLASLASSFGVDVGSMMGGGSSLFAYDNILDIMQSRKIVEIALLSEVNDENGNRITLADLYMNFMGLKKSYSANPKLAQINFKGNANRDLFSPLQDSILFVIYKQVIKNNLVAERTSKKTQIFKVQVNSKNQIFSKFLAERMVAETKNLYINIKTGTTQKNIERLQHKADSLLILLTGTSYESAETQILNPNPAIKSIGVPTKLASRNELMIGTLYTDIVKNLEMTKTTLMIQTPIIQILDTPRFPLENNKKGRFYFCFNAIALFYFLLLLFFFGKFALIKNDFTN